MIYKTNGFKNMYKLFQTALSCHTTFRALQSAIGEFGIGNGFCNNWNHQYIIATCVFFADKEAVERRLNVLQKQGVVYANSTEL